MKDRLKRRGGVVTSAADDPYAWFAATCPTLTTLIGQPSLELPSGIRHWLTGVGLGDWREWIRDIVCESPEDRPPISALEVKRLLSEDSAAANDHARRILSWVEAASARLVDQVGESAVRASYGQRLATTPVRDLVGLFAEIATCGWLTTFGRVKRLSPRTGRRRTGSAAETESEAVVEIDGVDVFVEVKRFEDNWESRRQASKPGRSLLTHDPVPPGTFRPYTMDLRSKLEAAPDQLPLDRPSILFVIVAARLPTDVPWLHHAVFGEPHMPPSRDHAGLHEGGLFLEDRWRSVSACCRTSILENGIVITPQIFYNPLATVPLADCARRVLEQSAASFTRA